VSEQAASAMQKERQENTVSPTATAAAANTAPRTPITDAERRRHLRIQSTALAVIATGGVLTLMYVAKPVLILALVSVLLAFMLAPIVELCLRLHIPRQVGAFIAVVLLCATIYGVFRVSYSQASDVLDQLPKYSGRIRNTLNQVRMRAERVRQTTRNVLPEDKTEKNALTVKQSTNWVEELTNGAANATEALATLAFIPFLVMLFSMENRNTAYTTLGLISQMIRGFIVGNVIIGLILGVTSTVAFWILGVPYFYVIGMISGVVSLLPYLGIVLAIIPPVLVSMNSLTMSSFAEIVTFVVISHLIALNVLYPKIIGRRLQLNPLAVTLALLFWGWLWGTMGVILAVPLTAAIKIIFDHVDHLKPWEAWLGE
jgi:predicted PurR-regulated permease PerM